MGKLTKEKMANFLFEWQLCAFYSAGFPGCEVCQAWAFVTGGGHSIAPKTTSANAASASP